MPSVRLARTDDVLVVAEGLARFADGWWEAGPQVPVTEFLGWVLAGSVVPHRRTRPTLYPLEARSVVWTAPQYARAEAVHLEAAQRREREERQHQAHIQALLDRQSALTNPAVKFVRQDADTYLTPVVGEPSPDFAMGIPVHLAGEPYAVICPVAGRVPSVRSRLSRLVLLVASEQERQRIAAQARPEQRIVVLQPEPAAAPSVPQQAQPGTITVRQAVTRMLGLDRM
ncbi:hypothetical protein ACFY0A_32370 [Streptomyces sp. NPDC001698]|uniref:hypothetical protein n=1 Tax=Streptomyces sp. NPDC001698 TaxID=3364601 RepID=UPI0036B58378